MAPGVILLTGAPEKHSLNWDEQNLLHEFSGAVARFIKLPNTDNTIQTPSLLNPTSPLNPSWRSIPLSRRHLPTGYSQNHWEDQGRNTEFFTTYDINSHIGSQQETQDSESFASRESLEDVLSQFYEQSYAKHENITSPQMKPSSESFVTSLGPSESSLDSFSATESFAQETNVPAAGHLTNISDIPKAAYLNSIHPQTMTVNIIVGIISIPLPRAIKTRRGAEVELVEVLVGDETKSGFGVNFWLSSGQELKLVLEGLRPQDVVLMRNVALSCFRGKVYGQSLRKGMTKVHLLYRNRIDKTDLGGCYHAADLVGGNAVNRQVEKTGRVREWVLRFVGVGVGVGNRPKNVGNRAFEVMKEILPLDTQ
ncbi:hypothetical protein B7494_g4270 [Chlorociboria aeruginascens]|nr:hypothetical protein B7494_g4270 [Chlorociboria aeruginascens]